VKISRHSQARTVSVYGEIFDARRPMPFAASGAKRTEPRGMPAHGAAGFGDRPDGVLIRRHGLHLDALRPIMSAVRQREWITEITLIPDHVRNGGRKLTLTPRSTRTAGATLGNTSSGDGRRSSWPSLVRDKVQR
jgi:hypothetical protein